MLANPIISSSHEVPSDIQGLHEFYAFWLELTAEGGTPHMDEFDYSRLEVLKPNIAELEIRNPGQEIYFLECGEKVCEIANGTLPGQRFVDAYGGPNWDRLEEIILAVARDAAPAHVTMGYHSYTGFNYMLETVYLPFLTDSGRAERIYSLTYAHDKDKEWPPYEEDGFLRHHYLVQDVVEVENI